MEEFCPSHYLPTIDATNHAQCQEDTAISSRKIERAAAHIFLAPGIQSLLSLEHIGLRLFPPWPQIIELESTAVGLDVIASIRDNIVDSNLFIV